jgi:tetratricopeptide (TPR) repeat protein
VANPRIDDLRKKLDKEPGSRLFAQLAEELRKDGDLAEAVRVSRQGLSHHPNYPSARMTLGRALLDSGDLASARREFETVLKGASDNILASRYLGECLEGLGQTAEALERYKATLAMAPGDKQLQAKIQALEKAGSAPAPVRSAAPAEPHPAPSAETPEAGGPDEPAPIRLVEVDGPMELTSRYDEATPIAGPRAGVEDLYVAQPEAAPEPPPADEAPIALVPVYEQEFELERPIERPPPREPTAEIAPVLLTPEPEDDEPILEPEPEEDTPVVAEPPTASAIAVAPPVATAPAPVVEPIGTSAPLDEPVIEADLEPDVIDEEFEVEAPAPAGPPRVTFRDIVDESIPPMSAAELAALALQAAKAAERPAAAPAPPPAPAAGAPAPPPEPELSSPTLAELYFDQGFFEKAIEVYRRLLQREPDNERLRARMNEIDAIQRRAAAPAGAPGSREEAIGRAIARLQDLRAALVARRS